MESLFSERNKKLLITFATIVLGGLLITDVIEDLGSGASVKHVTMEILAAFICAALAVYFIKGYIDVLLFKYSILSRKVGAVEKDRDEWRKRAEEYLKGLSAAIDEQFSSWGLSVSEKDIGYLILKGLSHKEIAQLRNTSDGTVRQQATAIYSKSGVGGRAELVAYFLEDLSPVHS